MEPLARLGLCAVFLLLGSAAGESYAAASHGAHRHKSHKTRTEKQLRTSKGVQQSATEGMEKEMEAMVAAEREAMNASDPTSKLKEELAALAWLEDELFEKQNGLNEEVYRGKVAAAEAAVAKDTSPGVAKMLGDMRLEMHALAVPFYSQVLEQQITEVKAKQQALLAQLESEQNLTASTTIAPVRAKTEAQPSSSSWKDGSWTSLLMVAVSIVLLLGLITAIVLLAARWVRRRNQSEAEGQ